MKGEHRLGPNVPTLAGMLRAQGYRCGSFSANGFICPEFGLTAGFDFATWGAWWENYLRLPPTYPPPNQWDAVGGLTRVSNQPSSALHATVRLATRFPVAMNVANLWLQRVFGEQSVRPLAITPWIEDSLNSWLAAQPSGSPAFCFVNLIDAHEPYIGDFDPFPGVRKWWERTNVKMDRMSVLSGSRTPSSSEYGTLHEMYQEAIRRIDVRIKAIVGSFVAAHRWDNTLMFLTSDHGQCFGEHGHIFHAQRLWEPITRIPFWMRLPRGMNSGRQNSSWASLVDIVPTVLELAGVRPPGAVSGVSLLPGGPPDSRRRVFAMADGLQLKDIGATMLSPEKVAEWDAPWIAGYEGPNKVLLNLSTGQIYAYDVTSDPNELNDFWPKSRQGFEELAREVRVIGDRLSHAPQIRDAKAMEDVDARLRAWGYV
jgi:arylsulfatase A-like enzyme